MKVRRVIEVSALVIMCFAAFACGTGAPLEDGNGLASPHISEATTELSGTPFSDIVEAAGSSDDLQTAVTIPPSDNENASKLVLYDMSTDKYIKFVDEPTRQMLNQQEQDGSIGVYTVLADGQICRSEYYKGAWKNETAPNGVYRLEPSNKVIVWKELIDFAGQGTSIQEYLAKNGIHDEVTDYAVIYAQKLPATIWAETTAGSVFITIDELEEDNDPYKEEGEYTFRLYTLQEYCERCLELISHS